ncbi:MAG: hypothetical protein KAJ72_03245, partial [Candidatus Heimdallarchaeota archaeon]|nr:hypothetical protein [Candidatus Heimdallarchaeota archaeon]
NWNLLEAQVKAEFGDDDEIFELILTEEDGFYTSSQSFELDSLRLYGRSSVDLHISATDYFGNSVTEIVTLNLTEYVDTADPVIGDYTYLVSQIDDKKFNVIVQVEVTEDLYVAEAYIHLYKGTSLKKTANLEFINDTHMKATVFSMYYVDGQPTEYTLKIEVIDAAGNIAELEIAIEDSPGDTSFGTVIIFISAIFVLGLAFRKRMR